jgi:GntR family transcriptional regulator
MGLSLHTTLELITPPALQGPPRRGKQASLSSDAVFTAVFVFRRLRDGTPFCVTTLFLPQSVGKIFKDVPELTEKGAVSSITVIGLIDTRLEQPVAKAEQSIMAVRSTPDLASKLDCEVGNLLLRIDRLYFDTKVQPVEPLPPATSFQNAILIEFGYAAAFGNRPAQTNVMSRHLLGTIIDMG